MLGAHLDASGGHLELRRELLPERAVGLCLLLEHVLEDLELGSGRALAMLDLVGGVRVESADVDLRRVHARRDEGGYAGLVVGEVV